MNDSIEYQIVTENIPSGIEPQLRFLDGGVPVWNFIILLVAIVLMLLNRNLFAQRFSTMLKMMFQPSDAMKMTREWNPAESVNGISALVVYVGLLSFILQKTVLAYTNNSILFGGIGFYKDVCMFIITYLILQHLGITFFGWLFGFKAAAARHEALHVSAIAAMDTIMIVIAMVVIFYPAKIILVIAVAIIMILTCIRVIKSFFEIQILTKMNLFQNFLYFCTLEIVPLSIAVTMMIRLIVSGCVL